MHTCTARQTRHCSTAPSMRATCEFVSAGVNRVVNALDWGDDGRIAYGSHHLVVVYDPQAAVVESTLVGHTGLVNCVKWIPRQVVPGMPPKCSLLVSGSADNSLRVWAVLDTRGKGGSSSSSGGAEHPELEPWRCIAVLQGHTAPVTALACHLLLLPPGPSPSPPPPHPFLLVSTAGDAAVRVWSCQPQPQPQPSTPEPTDPPLPAAEVGFGQQRWASDQLLHVGTHIQQALALTHLPADPHWLLLATGGTDKYVHLYVRAPGRDGRFAPTCRLPGHENWVRSLAFCHVAAEVGGAESAGAESAEVLLASASQDRYGRIWCVRAEPADGAAAAAEAAAAAPPPLAAAIARYAPTPRFAAAGRRLAVTFEALLIGHEDWLHSVCWRPTSAASSALPPRSAVRLLSSSMDRTMSLWRHEARGGGLWLSAASVGDAGAQCLGYFGGCFEPSSGGRRIVAHGFTGAMHLWEAAADGEGWAPRHALGGHFAPVTGCCWAADGGCVLSVSKDQTARVFTRMQGGHWCEMARPQVHGHDFTCVTHVARAPSAAGAPSPAEAPSTASYTYISGSEEKLLRVFEAPQVFLASLDIARGRQAEDASALQPQAGRKAFGAAIPALGLSNKAVYAEDAGSSNAGVTSGMSGGGYTEGPDFAPCAAPSVVSGPPLEEQLAQNTLWPEVHKLYGHGNDVYCCAASRDGRYAASACVAKSAAAAEIWVWSVASCQSVAQLQAHTLTVTQLAWSHSDDYLAACSRDRSFSVFRRLRSAAPGEEDAFQLVQRVRSAHSRVIWGIAWSPDNALLATGARDATVKLWALQHGDDTSAAAAAAATSCPPEQPQPLRVAEQAVATLEHPAAVHSLAFAEAPAAAGSSGAGAYTLAAGLEDGNIHIWRLARAGGGGLEAARAWQTSSFARHAAAVNALSWRHAATGSDVGPPGPGDGDGGGGAAALQLASCGDDHAVRVFSVQLL